jgi:hypothetical protein
MDEITVHGHDPHNEIVRLEARIEKLADKLESCRKFILAGRVAAAAGGLALIALLFGAIAFDPAIMACAVALALGGIVAVGSNRSTAQEAKNEMAAAEAERAALIGRIELRVVEDGVTLH